MRAMFPWSCRICKLVSLYLSIPLSFLDASFAHFAGRRTFRKPIQKEKDIHHKYQEITELVHFILFPFGKHDFGSYVKFSLVVCIVCTCGYHKPPQALFHSFELACNQYLIIKVVKFYSKYLHHEWKSIVWIEHQHLIFRLDIQFRGIWIKL